LFLVGQGWLSVIWRSDKIWFSFGQRVFESVSFWLVKAFDYLAFLKIMLFVNCQRLSCVSKFQSVGGGVFFQQVSLQVQPHLTKRAPDVWESARFTSIFLASSFFCSQTFSTPAHTRVTQTVGKNLH